MQWPENSQSGPKPVTDVCNDWCRIYTTPKTVHWAVLCLTRQAYALSSSILTQASLMTLGLPSQLADPPSPSPAQSASCCSLQNLCFSQQHGERNCRSGTGGSRRGASILYSYIGKKARALTANDNSGPQLTPPSAGGTRTQHGQNCASQCSQRCHRRPIQSGLQSNVVLRLHETTISHDPDDHT